MPCRLGQSIVLCRANNGDLAPAGRYDCIEHFIATTIVDPNGTSTTTFQDRWRCERTQRTGKLLIRGGSDDPERLAAGDINVI
jgi:hypothetical protein